jgi:hypothetical protein
MEKIPANLLYMVLETKWSTETIDIHEQDHAQAKYLDNHPTYPAQSDHVSMLLMSSLLHWLVPKPTHLPAHHQY